MTVRVLGEHELEAACALLLGGAVVGVPTDTVYGLAALLSSPAALDALYEAKRRPDTLPVAVLCADLAAADALATMDHVAHRLAAVLWPGPLTVVLRAPAALVRRVRASEGVGVRVPDDDLCRAVLARTGPLAVTSANLHGAPPARTAAEVASWFADAPVAAVLDGGVRDGEVSTVVDLTGEPAVVRPGARLDEVVALLSAR